MERVRAKVLLTLAAAVATSLVLAGVTFGHRPDNALPPKFKVTFDAQPAPIPVPSEGRIPVSLRLATSIALEDGSHPPPATELRFSFDRHLRLDLGDVPVCPTGIRSQGRRDKPPCPEAEVATGRSTWEVVFPGQEPVQLEGKTTAYKLGRGKLGFHVYLPAPVTGAIVTTAALTRAPEGSRHGLVATATIPKVAGGYGSLLYLGMRFRKGLFSAACPQGDLQTHLRARFFDGSRFSGTSFTVC